MLAAWIKVNSDLNGFGSNHSLFTWTRTDNFGLGETFSWFIQQKKGEMC
jgi:hypothetical protein